ncbi:MAG: DUF998 domain-containing protein [bacterium]|nr:DUF998 domain-containing protein [bacterium]
MVELGFQRRARLCLAAGAAAPLIHSLVVVWLGAGDARYDWKLKGVSVLGADWNARAFVMNSAGFVLPGVLLVAFGMGLVSLMKGRRGKIGGFAMALSGIGFVLSGLISLPNVMHMLVTLGTILAAAAAFVILGRSTSRMLGWPSWRLFSVFVAIAVVSPILMMFWRPLYPGLWQRASLVAGFAWVEVVSFGLLWRGVKP